MFLEGKNGKWPSWANLDLSCEVLHTPLTGLPRQSCAYQLVMNLCPCLDQVTLEYMNSLTVAIADLACDFPILLYTRGLVSGKSLISEYEAL